MLFNNLEMHKIAPVTKNYWAQNVNSAKVEKPLHKLMRTMTAYALVKSPRARTLPGIK